MNLKTEKENIDNLKRVTDRIQIVINALLALLSVILCFVPLAKIGNVSIGTPIELLVDYFEKTEGSFKYLNFSFPLLAFLCVGFALTRVGDFLLFNKEEIDFGNRKPLWHAIWIIFMFAAFISCALISSALSTYYNCKIITPYIFIALEFFSKFAALIVNIIIKLAHIKEPHVIRSKNKAFVALVILSFVASSGVIFFCGAISSTDTYPDSIKRDFEEGVFEIGDIKTEYSHNYAFYEGEVEKLIDFNGKSSISEIYGNNYYYYQSKIDELEEEIGQLMPKKSFEKYLKQVDKLKEDIKFLKNNAPKNYTRILFALGENEKHDYFEKEIIGFEYNQDSLFYDENGYKWNVKNKTLWGMFYSQQIELSCVEFSQGTDFSTEEIIAKVKYADGSMKISKIKPTNWEELNNSTVGTHDLMWRDNWGEYAVSINVK